MISAATPPAATSDLPLVHELQPAPKAEDVFHQLARLRGVLFLDSALRGSLLGRYSFIAAEPFDWLTLRNSKLQIRSEPLPRDSTDPFSILREILARYPQEPIPSLPPFQGGAAGLFGYALGRYIERLREPRMDDLPTPDLALGLYDWVIAFDHARNKAWVISTGHPLTESRARLQHAHNRLAEVMRFLEAPSPNTIRPVEYPARVMAPAFPTPVHPEVLSSLSHEAYLEAVQRAIEYIEAGDCFQVNLAQRLLMPQQHLSALALYDRLRRRNPATFAGYFDLGEYVLAGASPERFLRVQHGEVETRPIKGTRPRGSTPAKDALRKEELLASTKDRAENVMIVDLLRNDMGRVCEYGSVRVEALCRLETYATVHHLVSEVRGRLRSGLGPVDLLRAAFPGGSVTGAPKIRAMEIIAELEPVARGPYCGSLGYIGFDGSMDTNILIRTFTVGRGWIQFPVGGGIVADSVPEREYEETWHKAEGLLRALRE